MLRIVKNCNCPLCVFFILCYLKTVTNAKVVWVPWLTCQWIFTESVAFLFSHAFKLSKSQFKKSVCDFTNDEIDSIDTLICYSLPILVDLGRKMILYENIHYVKFNITGKFGLCPYLTRFSKSHVELTTFVLVG